jgi:hypothetical protein
MLLINPKHDTISKKIEIFKMHIYILNDWKILSLNTFLTVFLKQNNSIRLAICNKEMKRTNLTLLLFF